MELIKIEKIRLNEDEQEVLERASEILDEIAGLKQDGGISEWSDIKEILNARDLIESFVYDEDNF